jgi:hypothetical protein
LSPPNLSGLASIEISHYQLDSVYFLADRRGGARRRSSRGNRASSSQHAQTNWRVQAMSGAASSMLGRVFWTI